MSVDANKALVRRFLDEIYNRKNADFCDEFLDEEYAAFEKEWIRTLDAAFPDMHMTVDQMIGENDQVVAAVTVRGTHTGELKGPLVSWLTPPLPPTGKQIEVQGIFIYRVVDGILTNEGHSGQADWLGMLRQLDVIPSPT